MRVRGYFLLVTGFLACPCHLPLTLPLVIALTAGTALGVFLANNGMFIVGISTAYFVGALALGIRYLRWDEKGCEAPNTTAEKSEKSGCFSGVGHGKQI